MNRFDAISDWWAALSLREQRLVAVMGVLVALTLLWFAVISPLRAAADAARTRQAESARVLAEVRSLSAAVAAAERARPARGAAVDIEAAVLAAATDAGLVVARHSREGQGAVSVVIDAAPAGAVFGWIEVLQRDSGVSVSSLSAVKNEDASLRIEAAFVRGGA